LISSVSPTTAASATSLCYINAYSKEIELNLWPEILMTSADLVIIWMYPSPSLYPESPVK